MKILYIGDIMAQAGITTVQEVLPQIKESHQPDVIIAQAENVTDGKSMSLDDMHTLQAMGIDFFTGGNHTPAKKELHDALRDPSQPVIGPANMTSCPGSGYKVLDTKQGQVLVISLLGATVGKEVFIENPLLKIDEVLSATSDKKFVATVVNFHGDYSSEKRIIGYYLDGKASLVVGDHWHVPTADAMILPIGTAHMTDVGMCGSLHSSLGVTFDAVVPRWRDGKITKNEMATDRPYQFNAVIVDVDETTGLANSVEHIQKIID